MDDTLSRAGGVRRARISIGVTFAAHGAVVGTFATRLPWIADRLHTQPGALGIALLFSSIGAMAAMPFAGRLIHRYDVRTVLGTFMVLWCLALIPTAFAPSVPVLCAAMLLFGATAGMADVAMNAEGVAIEQRAGRSIMSGLHGMWSLGGLVASGIGVLAAHADVPAPVHFAAVGVALAVTAMLAAWFLPTTPAEEASTKGDDNVPAFALPPRSVLLIALVAFAAVFGESASSDWAALYLTDVAHAAPGIAAAAFSGFAATMAAARLVGDRVVDRFGPVRTVTCGGIAATAGALLVSVSRSPAPAIAGFALIGLGVAVVVPLAFAAAGKAGPRPGQQIAGVATIAYGSGLAAPASIGGIAQVTSLPVSFLVVALLTSVIIVGATTLKSPSH